MSMLGLSACVGTWRLDKVKLLDDGVYTKEHVLVPECVHTITMEWYSSHRGDHVSYALFVMYYES